MDYNNFTANDTRTISEALFIHYPDMLIEQQKIEKKQELLREQQRIEQEQYEQQIQQEIEQNEQQKESLKTKIEKTQAFMESVIAAKIACECASISVTEYGKERTSLEGKMIGGVHSMFPSCKTEAETYVPLAVTVNVIKKIEPDKIPEVKSGFFANSSDYSHAIKSTLKDTTMKENVDFVKAKYSEKGYGDIINGITVGDVIASVNTVNTLYADRGIDIQSIDTRDVMTKCLIELMEAKNETDKTAFEAGRSGKDVYLISERGTYPISCEIADMNTLTFENVISAGRTAELYRAGVKSTDEQQIRKQFPEYSDAQIKGTCTMLQAFEENGLNKNSLRTAEMMLQNSNTKVYVYEVNNNFAMPLSEKNVETYKKEFGKDAEIDTRPKTATIDRGLANRDPEHYVAPSQTTVLSAEDTVEFKSDAVSVEDVITKYNQKESLAPSTIQRAEEETGRDLDNDGDIADKFTDEEKSSKKKSDVGLGLD